MVLASYCTFFNELSVVMMLVHAVAESRSQSYKINSKLSRSACSIGARFARTYILSVGSPNLRSGAQGGV